MNYPGARNSNWKGGRIHDRLGYIRVLLPDHPNVMKNGYILEHRLIMATFLGQPLRPDEIIHHINENRADNRIENLLLMSLAAHISLHTQGVVRRKRVEAACLGCEKIFWSRPGTPRRASRKYCSQQCSRKHRRGEAQGTSKLSRSRVDQIRATRGMTQRQIGAMFGVSKSTIGRVLGWSVSIKLPQQDLDRFWPRTTVAEPGAFPSARHHNIIFNRGAIP